MMFRSLLIHAVSRNSLINLVSLAVLLVLVSFLVSCSRNSDLAVNSIPKTNAISGYDPVAYFTEAKPVSGNENFSYAWNDLKWFFSSKENMEIFKKDPKQYAPQYNGCCAFAQSRNNCVDVNPEAWAIVNGKLYFTYNHSIRNAWLQDKENYIAKADRHWQNNKLSKN